MESNQQSDPFHPVMSAQALPHLLRQKLARQLQQRHIATSKTVISKATLSSPSKRIVPAEDRHCLYTSSELEDEIQRLAAAVSSTQRHIQLGEESYYEETFAHGSIFAGWDGFIDNRDIIGAGNGNGGSGGTNTNHSSSAPMRRMPVDHRWFSSSHAGGDQQHASSTTRYLLAPNMDHGIPITVMTEEESAAAMEQEQAQEGQEQAPTQAEESKQEQADKDDGNQDDEKDDHEPEAQEEPTEDDNKKSADRKGKRKAAVVAPPAVSTRPKRTRK